MTGIITIVNGGIRYWHMAADLAASVKLNTTLPISVLVSPEAHKSIPDVYRSLFDAIIELPDSNKARNLAKLYTAEYSPYDYTIYIDADCLVLRSLESVQTQIEASEAGYMLQGEYLAPTAHVFHNGWYSDNLCRQYELPRYFKCNSGLMAFRKEEGKLIQSHARNLLDEFRWQKMRRFGHMSDEILLGITIPQFELDQFTEPVPMAWALHYLRADIGEHKIVHAIGRPSLATARWFLKQAQQVRVASNLEPSQSKKYWIRKIAKSYYPF